MKIEKLELSSVDGTQLNLDALYQIAPSCFTEIKDEKTGELRHVINFKVLRQLLGDNAIEDTEEVYQFTWPGKQEARREAARPTTKTLRPIIEDSVDWDNTQNLYIEGDNLEVLKLLQKSYMGKVKMIYIDPPYNTGNDFIYDDDFAHSQQEEDLALGNIDELGNRYRKNTDTNGRFHSDWCSMMYSRLLVARSLLTEDGVIFISIDDNEVENLKKICNEIFGESNFVGCICRATGTTTGQDANKLGSSFDYCLVYSKSNSFILKGVELDEKDMKRFSEFDGKGRYSTLQLRKTGNADRREDRPNMFYSVIAPDGSKVYPFGPTNYLSRWRVGKITYEQLFNNDMIIWKEDLTPSNVIVDGIRRSKWVPYVKYYLEGRTKQVSNLFQDIEGNKKASIVIKELFGEKGIFDYPKPVEFLSILLKISTDSRSLILDFFSGSSTTAHAVMHLNAEDGGNRKYIMVQLPEKTPENSEAYKVGYSSIPQIAKERIRRAGAKIKQESPLTTQNLDTGFRVFRLADSNFEEVKKAPNEYNQSHIDLFLNNIKADRTDLDLLFGAMLSWGVELSLPMSTEEIDGKIIYSVNEGDLVACFAEDITENILQNIASKKPLRVLFRDGCFTRDDLKINVFETLKQLLDWSEEEAIKNIKVI